VAKIRLFGMFNKIKGLRGNNLDNLNNLRFLGYMHTYIRAYWHALYIVFVFVQPLLSDAYEKTVDYLDYLDYYRQRE